jgi:hypothetical protein
MAGAGEGKGLENFVLPPPTLPAFSARRDRKRRDLMFGALYPIDIVSKTRNGVAREI